MLLRWTASLTTNTLVWVRTAKPPPSRQNQAWLYHCLYQIMQNVFQSVPKGSISALASCYIFNFPQNFVANLCFPYPVNRSLIHTISKLWIRGKHPWHQENPSLVDFFTLYGFWLVISECDISLITKTVLDFMRAKDIIIVRKTMKLIYLQGQGYVNFC